MPHCIMGKIHMGPPQIELDRQTDRQTCVKTLPSRKLRMREVITRINKSFSIWKYTDTAEYETKVEVLHEKCI